MAKEDYGMNFGWFLSGLILGAGAALLLAPETGEDTRKMIAKRAKSGSKVVADSSRDVLDRGRELYERGREMAEDAAEMFERGRKLAEKKIDEI